MIKIIKHILYKMGYKLNKINNQDLLHDNYLLAIKKHIGAQPVLFDIGANEGQTIEKFKTNFPESIVHSFEPSKLCFDILKKRFTNVKDIKINNVAVGIEEGALEFNEYAWSSLNSLLKRSFTSSKIIDNYLVDIVTVDNYCVNNNINKINLLKTDTEGFELNVLKGASRMMKKNSIQFVYVEIFFFNNYIGQSSFGDIYNHMLENGFNLIKFYDFEYTGQGYANRTDALFINSNFNLN